MKQYKIGTDLHRYMWLDLKNMEPNIILTGLTRTILEDEISERVGSILESAMMEETGIKDTYRLG